MCVLDGSSTLQDWMIWDHHPIRRSYDVVMDLGEGAFSSVVLGRHKDTKQLAALKVVYLLSPDMDDDHLAVTRREAEFLNMLDCPRIVECLDVVDDGRQLVMVLEYLRGGQLYDSLHRLGGSLAPYTEQAAAAIFAQMAEGVAFMHDYGIIHRDIKGENFVFEEDPAHAAAKGRAPAVKLIDLGMSIAYDPKVPVIGALGSPGFVSPEIVNDGTHTPAMDVYSLGVVAFVMLVGRKPFSIQQSETLEYCNLDVKDAPGLKDPRWLMLSASAKDLVMGMMAHNIGHRLTAQQVVEHQWVATRAGGVRGVLGDAVAHGAANVASLRRLRNLVHGVVSLNRLSETLSAREAQRRNAARFADSRAASHKRKGYRNDPSGRGISRRDRRVVAAAASSSALLHDAGLTFHPSEDISVHFHGNRCLQGGIRSDTSAHSSSGRGSGRHRMVKSGSGDVRGRSLKRAGSAIILSEVEMEGSYHGGLNGSHSVASLAHMKQWGGVRGGMTRTHLTKFSVLGSIARLGSKSDLSCNSDEDPSASWRRGGGRGEGVGDESSWGNRSSTPTRQPLPPRQSPPPADSAYHGQMTESPPCGAVRCGAVPATALQQYPGGPAAVASWERGISWRGKERKK